MSTASTDSAEQGIDPGLKHVRLDVRVHEVANVPPHGARGEVDGGEGEEHTCIRAHRRVVPERLGNRRRPVAEQGVPSTEEEEDADRGVVTECANLIADTVDEDGHPEEEEELRSPVTACHQLNQGGTQQVEEDCPSPGTVDPASEKGCKTVISEAHGDRPEE